MQLRFQLQGKSSVTKGKQGRVKETEGVLNGAVYSHCHGFFSVQKIIRLPAMVVTQVQLDRAKVSTKSAVLMNLESRDIRRELGMEIIEEHTVMEYSKVNKKCEKCGHGEATYYTRLMRSADKGQTTFYTCTSYGHPSQEN
ncbi:DNA-directed RNA polymerase I subunit RPA12 [Glycine soja]|nr:DNA-directed RNA polymerase I subunit RPA12 [Glycine soja]